MTARGRNIAAAGLITLLGAGLLCTGCASSKITASTTCKKYLEQSEGSRHDAAVRISSELRGVSNPGNPMWGLSLDGACGSDPKMTIGQYFGRGSGAPAQSGTSSQSETTATVGSAPANQENSGIGATIGAELAGIQQVGNVAGASDAPVTLAFFADLESPICKQFALGALPSIIKKWVRPGKLKIAFHSLETATREPEIFKQQQVAALAAGKQHLFWSYVELFYHEQREEGSGYVTESYLQSLAQQVPGLNLAQWTADRNDGGLSAQVAADAQMSNHAGLTATPSFLIGRSGAPLKKLEYASLSEPTSFDQAIERLLRA